jgi:multidrug resistance protein, MATE family
MRAGAKVAIALSMGFALITVLLFLTVPGPIIRLFLDAAKPESAQIVVYGTALLAVAALFQFVDALQVMALGLLRGVKDTRVPMWIAALSYWIIGIPASYMLAFVAGYGGVGLWLGLVIGLTAAAGMLMTRFWVRA